jgi:hypothetical protein
MAAERFGIQLPRARCIERPQKKNDLAREAVSCNAGLGHTAEIGFSFKRSPSPEHFLALPTARLLVDVLVVAAAHCVPAIAALPRHGFDRIAQFAIVAFPAFLVPKKVAPRTV